LSRFGPAGAAFFVALAVLLLGCGEADDALNGTPPSSQAEVAASLAQDDDMGAEEGSDGDASARVDVEVAPVEITEDSFRNVNDMTAVRGFFVHHLLRDLDATVAVAESSTGGVYPVGSLVQLFPGEAMVKREPGFSPLTRDWEFFELDVSAEGTTIRVRGGAEVINRFGGSCADCHAMADSQWDFICEQGRGCDPLPIERAAIEALQDGDPRPRV